MTFIWTVVILLCIVVLVMAAVMTAIIIQLNAAIRHVDTMIAGTTAVLNDAEDLRRRVSSMERRQTGMNRKLREIELRANAKRFAATVRKP